MGTVWARQDRVPTRSGWRSCRDLRETVIVRGRNTQARKRTKRSTVAAALAATRTPSSTAWLAAGARTPSRASAPVVRPSPSPKTTRPWNWCRTAPPRPRTPKVSRRFAAVLATAVSSSARRFAAIAPDHRRGAAGTAAGRPAVLTTPIAANRTSWRVIPPAPRAALGASGARPSCARSSATGSAPEPSARPTRPMPLQVVQRRRDDVDPAVGVVDPVDRHLVDPQPGALGQHQQLGVEEPAGVLDQRQQPAGDVGADRLEAALGVGEPGCQRAAQQQVVAAGDELPLGAADDPATRGPAGCRSRGRSARRSAGRPAAAARPGRWTGRRPCRRAPARRRPPTTARSARPRPFSGSCTDVTAGQLGGQRARRSRAWRRCWRCRRW